MKNMLMINLYLKKCIKNFKITFIIQHIDIIKTCDFWINDVYIFL